MSSEYYFKLWKRLLDQIQQTVDEDIDYQTAKIHDQKLSDAVQRLSGMLGQYMHFYNQLKESARMNLQVQKAQYIKNMVQCVVARINELQNEISKLEGTTSRFLSKSLIERKLTTNDVELTEIPQKVIRAEHIQQAIEDGIKRAKEERKRLEEIDEEKNSSDDPRDPKKNYKDSFEENPPKEFDETELEMKKRKDMLNLIAANEKARQAVVERKKLISKREMWEKELVGGTLQPPARIELREKAAEFIQRFARAYFQAKRKKIEICKRDYFLGYRLCENSKCVAKLEAEKIGPLREQKRKKYEADWKRQCAEVKEKCYNKRAECIAEDYRDEIRDWFQTWYKKAIFFYDIPLEKDGGSSLILKEELPTPSEWLEQYKIYQVAKNKKKTAEQIKEEKLAAKQEAKLKKKEEQARKRMEEALLAKMKKNPGNHPGYTYPKSKNTDDIIKALEDYHKDWDLLDEEDKLDIKERHITAIDESNAWMEVKMEVRTKVDEDMRNELKKLRVALKEDYERREEEMPEMIPEPKRKAKKKKKVKDPFNEKIPKKLERLALEGVLHDYPRTKFEDVIGDANFAGEDLREVLIPPIVMGAETRRSWWERCTRLVSESQRVLIIGPKGSGKTTLAYALATINDAVFFDVDLNKFYNESDSIEEDLRELSNTIAACTRAVQPSIIYIRHVHRLYYRKNPPEGPALNQELLMRLLLKPLLKKIQKSDKITVIGTCLDPWLTKANQILKQFPNVVLTPTTSYSTTFLILRTWMAKNRAIPPDLDVHSLAYILQGYSFDFLRKTLQDFVTAERIVKIAAGGLIPEQVYDFILENETEEKPEYIKYQDWYSKKTPQGKSELKNLLEQQEFRELERQLLEKKAKKKPGSAAASAEPSLAGSIV